MVQFCYSRLYFGIETISCHQSQWVVKDGLGLKLEKLGPTFSSINAMPPKSPKI